MITLNGSTANLVGLSTDTKPINVDTNTMFLELDTGAFYYFDGRECNEVGGASNESV